MGKLNDLSGRKFNRITVLKRDTQYSQRGTYYKCLCDCGIIKSIAYSDLLNGKTQSCGCLHQEITRKYSNPSTFSAKRVWRKYQDGCSFEKFMELSQLPCFYCGILGSNNFNAYITKNGKYAPDITKEWADQATFIYNGLDRVDNTKLHQEDNIVACCKICNFMKGAQTQQHFLQHISKLRNQQFIPYNIPNINLPDNKFLKRIINTIYHNYTTRDKLINFNVKQFYYLSQLPCFYCGVEKSNIREYKIYHRIAEKEDVGRDFGYNGLDRVNNKLPHVIDNVVPCCKICNIGKNNYPFLEFQQWISRVKSFNGRSQK